MSKSATTDTAVRDLLLWMRKEGIAAHSIQVGDVTITGLSGIVRDKDGKPTKADRPPSMLEQLAGPLAGAMGLEVETNAGTETLEPIKEDEDDA